LLVVPSIYMLVARKREAIDSAAAVNVDDELMLETSHV
jgi:hypothetical protein